MSDLLKFRLLTRYVLRSRVLPESLARQPSRRRFAPWTWMRKVRVTALAAYVKKADS